MLREERIESPDGESSEGVGETRLTTGTIFTDKLFTGQREMRRPEPVEGAGLGIYHYGARFYSPKLGRFLSADTIVPGAANPQAYNRYSYVLGNPLKYTDPTGHGQCRTQEECADMGTTPMGTGNPHRGGGGNGGRDGCRHNDPDCRGDGGLPDSDGDNGVINDIFETIIHDDLQALEDNDCFTQSPGTIDWTNSTCVDAVSFLLQDIATLSSSVSASWTATLTALGCVGAYLTAGISCGAGYALGYADHLMFFNPLESTASFFSFTLTAYSDLLTQDTYFNSPTDWGIGEDTKTGLAAFAYGTYVVEPFLDAGIDIYASGYNHGYFCGISTLAGCIGSSIINAFP